MHLLRLLAHHHEQDHTEKNAGRDQHFAIWQTLLKYEREHCDHAGENDAKQRALEDNAATQAEIVALQKKDDLEPFAIKRGESKQDQSPPEMPL